jgi:hypothetical protein
LIILKANFQPSFISLKRLLYINMESSAADQLKVKASNFVTQHAGKLRDHYRIGKMLGSGAFGEVRVCVHRESGA